MCHVCIYSVKMLHLLSLVSGKMDRKALREILSEFANNDALTVTEESNGYVVSLRTEMQEAVPKVRFHSACIKCTGNAVTLCIK